MSDSSRSSISIEDNSENELGLDYKNYIEDNELSTILSNLDISVENINCITMAVPKFEAKLLDIVPNYNGNPVELSSFLDIANTLIANYWDPNPENINCVQNITLIFGIYAKLSGPAREVYTTCISKDWKAVKDALVAHFGDQRDENGLLFDLDQLRQKDNENPLQFYTRVMSNLSALHNYIGIHQDLPTIKTVKKDFYNTHALKIFLAGLKEPLGSTIRAMKPETLAEARQYIVSEINIKHLQKPNLDRNKTHFPNQYIPRQVQHPNPYVHRQVQNFNQPPPHNYPRMSQFPSRPIQLQHRPVQPPQRFFTNQQVFHNNRPNQNSINVWKPQGTANRPQFPKPVPMSGISHGTSPKPNPPFQQRQPNFASGELHNIEQPTYTQYYDPVEYTYENFENFENYETDTADLNLQDQYCDEPEIFTDNTQETPLAESNQNFHETRPTTNPP